MDIIKIDKTENKYNDDCFIYRKETDKMIADVSNFGNGIKETRILCLTSFSLYEINIIKKYLVLMI